MKTPPSQQTPSGGSMRRLVLRLERWLYRFEARRLAARVEEDSYRMYCLGYPKEGRITIMEEARRFEKWAEDKFSENADVDASADKKTPTKPQDV